MRFAADVAHQSVRPQDNDRFTVVPVVAASAMEAARKVAEIAAARLYEETGEVGFLSPTATEGWFHAAIGEQRKSHSGITLRGVTISIHVWTVD